MVSGSLEGSCGRWQARLAILLSLPVLLTGMYCTNYVFLAAHTPHRCKVLECEDTSWEKNPELTAADVWSPVWSSWALPEDNVCQKFQALDPHCTANSFDNSSRVVCEEFVYESQRSIVAEFDLGCQDWKRTLVGTVHNVGMLVSLPIIGYVSDRWGRRTALVVSGTGVGVFGLLKSFVPNYYLYLVMEFVETVLGASVYPAAFVLMIEWLGVEQRILASLVLGIPLSAGAATLALLDWLTGYWRHWARIAYPPSFLILLYIWVLPESVRWLITNGRLAEALDVLKRAARCNKVDINDEALEKMLMTEVEQKEEKEEVIEVEEEGLLRAFIRYPTLRRRLLVCFAWWMSAVFVFYGLAVRAQALAGSPHANYALVAAAELPALLINTLLLDRLGRRPMLTIAFMITATALIAIPCLPDQSSWISTALYLAGKMGATMTLNALYIYTAELFPTRARHRCLAACSTLGRVGSILAPQTPLLAKYKIWLPTLLFGALPLLSAALTPLVPDTLHKKLPDTYADLDRKSPSYVRRRDV